MLDSIFDRTGSDKKNKLSFKSTSKALIFNTKSELMINTIEETIEDIKNGKIIVLLTMKIENERFFKLLIKLLLK